MTPDFDSLLTILQANMLPAMRDALADDLNVSADAIRRAGVGYYPAENAWIFPERDERGNVVNLFKRYRNGDKRSWPGGKRGYGYECVGIQQKNETIRPAPRFARVAEYNVACPICGRENDGCLVSDEDPDDPAAVICVRTAEGAIKTLDSGAGYLHHRHSQPDRGYGRRSPLLPSDKPVVVTEGASDALAAMSAGYVAISRPSAGHVKGLSALVQGLDIICIGDRDTHGVGQRGLEVSFAACKEAAKSVVKALPPEPYKDLRAWAPTAEQFAQHVNQTGSDIEDSNLLPDSAPLTLAKVWLQKMHMHNGQRLMHFFNGDYYRWNATHYRKLETEELKREWYDLFTGHPVKMQMGDGIKIVKLSPGRKFTGDMNDVASAVCYIRSDEAVHEPFYIRNGMAVPMDLARSVVFRNGVYQLDADILSPLTPEVFLTSTLPYDYLPGSLCPIWIWFVSDVFNGDQECIALLQEWFGYCLIASNHMQAMMFFYGVPGSGKSTTAAVLHALLGKDRATAASTETFKSLFGSAKLVNKYVAIMSESRDTRREDIDKLLQTWKAITGGDTVDVRQLYKAHRDARLFCRLTYVANDAIPFDDTAQAMASRMNLLYFPNNYRAGTPDRMLEAKLCKEAPGIALWSLEGLRRLLTKGEFTMPARSRKHLDQLAELTNPIGSMMEECVIRHRGADMMNYRVGAAQLYDLWTNWCDATRTRNNMTASAFGLKLAHLDEPIEKIRTTEAGRRVYAYPGLQIRPEAMERYLK
jgi:P4 family phage/plasmid primase-like protien